MVFSRFNFTCIDDVIEVVTLWGLSGCKHVILLLNPIITTCILSNQHLLLYSRWGVKNVMDFKLVQVRGKHFVVGCSLGLSTLC